MSNTRIAFTRKSRNAKIGPIPTTTTSACTCPPSCPFYGRGCYAKAGLHTRLHWDRVTAGTRGGSLADLCQEIRALPIMTPWRHNVAGDLPGVGERINGAQLQQLTRANRGRRGWTYTHKRPDVRRNARHIRDANRGGFTVNLSANNPAQADEYAELGIAPVVTVLPIHQTENTVTPAGRRVVVCPATQRDDLTCASCMLCQRRDRSVIVGFPAHGPARQIVSRIAEGGWTAYDVIHTLAALIIAFALVLIPALAFFL